MPTLRLIALMLVLLALSRPAFAGTIGLELISGSPSNNVIDFTVGWSFHVNAPIRIDALGFYDYDGNGLNRATDIGLWRDDGKLLATTTVSAGTSAALIESFRFVSIDPIVLGPHNYTIGAVTNTSFGFDGDRVIDVATILTAPQITFLENLASDVQTTNLRMPDVHYPRQGPGFFGPNFTFTRVPEPSTVALMSAGLLAILALKRHS